MKRLIPLIIFVVLAGFLYVSLGSDPRQLPSPLLGKTFPKAVGTDLFSGEVIDLSDEFSKGISLVNVWASWCTTCRKEHQMLLNISQNENIQLIGIAYKDTKADAQKYLKAAGNPFDLVVFDPYGNIGLDLGVYATPETFLVDKQGLILYKHVGEINSRAWKEDFEPILVKKE